MSSLEKWVFRSSAIFYCIACFLVLKCMNSWYILDISPFSDKWFAIIFFHSVVAFSFVDSFLCCAGAFQFDVVSVVNFHCCSFGVRIKKLLPRPVSRSLLSLLYSKSFMVSGLTDSNYDFKVLWIQVSDSFCVNFCIWCKIVIKFHSFACGCTVFPISFIEEAVLPHCIFLAFLL